MREAVILFHATRHVLNVYHVVYARYAFAKARELVEIWVGGLIPVVVVVSVDIVDIVIVIYINWNLRGLFLEFLIGPLAKTIVF